MSAKKTCPTRSVASVHDLHYLKDIRYEYHDCLMLGDKGYIGKGLFSKLFIDVIQLITRLKNNMNGGMRSMYDRILPRKRVIIEAINDELKNIAQIKHPRTRDTVLLQISL